MLLFSLNHVILAWPLGTRSRSRNRRRLTSAGGAASRRVRGASTKEHRLRQHHLYRADTDSKADEGANKSSDSGPLGLTIRFADVIPEESTNDRPYQNRCSSQQKPLGYLIELMHRASLDPASEAYVLAGLSVVRRCSVATSSRAALTRAS